LVSGLAKSETIRRYSFSVKARKVSVRGRYGMKPGEQLQVADHSS